MFCFTSNFMFLTSLHVRCRLHMPFYFLHLRFSICFDSKTTSRHGIYISLPLKGLALRYFAFQLKPKSVRHSRVLHFRSLFLSKIGVYFGVYFLVQIQSFPLWYPKFGVFEHSSIIGFRAQQKICVRIQE